MKTFEYILTLTAYGVFVLAMTLLGAVGIAIAGILVFFIMPSVWLTFFQSIGLDKFPAIFASLVCSIFWGIYVAYNSYLLFSRYVTYLLSMKPEKVIAINSN